MKYAIGIMLGIIVIVGIGLVVFSGDKTGEVDVAREGQEAQNEPSITEEGTPEQPAQPNDAMMNSGSYEEYGAEKIALAEDGKVVLFFHASWCPSCRALNSDIEKNAGTIPSGVTILKTDYDQETDLKKKYGVTTQHTLVQVDEAGNLIKKWSGGSKLENLLTELQ
jgi:thioredoxin 1